MNKVFENARYYVQTGEVVVDGDRKVSGYQTVNILTGIVEYEDTILPQAIMFANGAADHLDELYAEEGTASNVVSLN